MDSPVQQRVLVAGGGVAGSVVALLLKQKGWQPVVLEKVKKVGPSGLALVVQSNGMKVLNKAGVIDFVLDGTLSWDNWNDWSDKGDFLGGPGSKSVGNFTDRYGWPAIGLSRTKLQLGLKDGVEAAGVPFLEGWKIRDIKVGTNSVTAISEDGKEIEGAFVIGTDGLKSATRDVIFARNGFKDREVAFTGIEVIGGTCPTPKFLADNEGVNIFWGRAETIISHPLENGTSIWGATVPADHVTPESWLGLSPEAMETARQTYLARWKDWHPVISEMIRTSSKMLTIGLYDRGDLAIDHWYHDRMMLLGDAAHPTTPHAGQGANQCLEDAWSFSQKLPDYDTNKAPLSTADLTKIFRAVAEERQPRTSAVMAKALKYGEERVLRGDRANEEGERARNEMIRRRWNEDYEKTVKVEQDEFCNAPFDDRGGYQRWLENKKT